MCKLKQVLGSNIYLGDVDISVQFIVGPLACADKGKYPLLKTKERSPCSLVHLSHLQGGRWF